MSTTRITVATGGTTRVTQVGAVASLRNPSRVLSVDASFAGLHPPAFTTLAEAEVHARAVVDASGGRVLVRLFHGADGEPLTAEEDAVAALAADGVDVECAGLPSGGARFDTAARFADFLLTGELDEPAMTYDIDEARMGIDITTTPGTL